MPDKRVRERLGGGRRPRKKGGGQRTGVCEPLANTIKGDLLSLGLRLLVRSVVNQIVHLTPVGVSVSWVVFL